ncbi:MAG: alpha/beta fold hydrolase [Nitrospirae bacterium]|nr:MAG: alpha/beta fold hydrolase [Nitrospirota bacterium]
MLTFDPHPLLKGPHRMTLASRWWPRPPARSVPEVTRLFDVEPGSRISTKCHWQPIPHLHPTLLLVHGLEGCTDSHYMIGIGHKAWRAAFNVVRMNQRNCGGTEHLTPTLYHGGLSHDLYAVIKELVDRDRLPALWVVGYSMGGNLALKLAGEVGATLPQLKGIVAVCPNIHPAACVTALQHPRNWIYHTYFLTHLKRRLKRKARWFPNKWDLTPLDSIRTLWEFDDCYTAKDGGFRDAADYYERSGARHVLAQIAVPTLIITAQDDPFIPFETFDLAPLRFNSAIQLVAPSHGGHCGFLQRPREGEDLYWAENRIVDFLRDHARRTIAHTPGSNSSTL